jgi:hypothetical protein
MCGSGTKYLPVRLLVSVWLRAKYLKQAQVQKTIFLIEMIDTSIDGTAGATQQLTIAV